ncbi:MAG: hypothetical protein ABJH68_17795 [Ilumatobacter sp.]|uniref:hypothetical protein n=1 Tax=Ilumatobacter sp. TaxID=1967498 RepID=UPI00329810A8
MVTDDWYWDIDRQVAVRVDNAGRHDLLIGPYATRPDAEVWMPTGSWTERPDGEADDWVDVNSAYD